MTDTLPEIQDVVRINLNADDTVVVRCKDRLSQDRAARIQAIVSERFPNNRVLVLDSGLSLDVLGPTDMAVAPGNDRVVRPQRDFHDS